MSVMPSEPNMSVDPGMSVAPEVSETPTLDAFGAGSGGAGQSVAAPPSDDDGYGSGVDTYEDGDLSCEGEMESGEEMGMIRRYVREVAAAVGPWRTQRRSTNLVFDVNPLNSLTRRFKADYNREFRSLPLPATMRAELDQGTTRSSLQEIWSFNPALIELPQWLGLSAEPLEHEYTLSIEGGLQASAVLGGRAVLTTLKYRNDHEMEWEQDGMIVYGIMNAETTLGSDGVNIGGVGAQIVPPGELPSSPNPRIYFRPEDLNGAGVTFLEMGASASMMLLSGGVVVEAVQLVSNGRSIRFDNTASVAPALQPRVGIDEHGDLDLANQVAVGAQTGMGVAVAPTDPDLTNSPTPLEESEQTDGRGGRIQTVATLFFGTAEEAIEADQTAALRDLVAEIQAVEDRFPGAIYHATITGTASRRWKDAPSPEEALRRNRDLAMRRAQNTRSALEGMLNGPDMRFTSWVREMNDANTVEAPPEVLGETPSSNLQEDRTVIVDVRWEPCNRAGRAQSWQDGNE